jgi:hypothetical protein
MKKSNFDTGLEPRAGHLSFGERARTVIQFSAIINHNQRALVYTLIY